MAQIEYGIPSKLIHPLMSASFRKVAESELNFQIRNFVNPKIGRAYVSETVFFDEINGHWNVVISVLKKEANGHHQLGLRFMILPKWESKSNVRYTVKAEVMSNDKVIFTTPDYFLQKATITDEFHISIKNDVKSISFNVKLSLSCNSNGHHYFDTTAVNKQILNNNIDMLNDPTYSDFVFVVEGKEFNVHKNILAATSPVFVKIFNSGMQESIQNKCIVDEIASDTFADMLRFIYGGVLPQNMDKVSMSLYEAAHYYDLKNLMEICKKSIRGKLSADNANDIYIWAELYDVEDLKTEALKELNNDGKLWVRNLIRTTEQFLLVGSSFSPGAIEKLMKKKEMQLLERLSAATKPIDG